jgi:DNA-binding transcriptional MerR regulator
MGWKIGEMAKRSGLSVRALHHYDAGLPHESWALSWGSFRLSSYWTGDR